MEDLPTLGAPTRTTAGAPESGIWSASRARATALSSSTARPFLAAKTLPTSTSARSKARSDSFTLAAGAAAAAIPTRHVSPIARRNRSTFASTSRYLATPPAGFPPASAAAASSAIAPTACSNSCRRSHLGNARTYSFSRPADSFRSVSRRFALSALCFSDRERRFVLSASAALLASFVARGRSSAEGRMRGRCAKGRDGAGGGGAGAASEGAGGGAGGRGGGAAEGGVRVADGDSGGAEAGRGRGGGAEEGEAGARADRADDAAEPGGAGGTRGGGCGGWRGAGRAGKGEAVAVRVRRASGAGVARKQEAEE
mmetsp:Transcript_15860/g.40832  ORF Transcript_15860/g.40832 Transcript_15860/m.40832 type:complete len:313 (+) Transcript_15860:379-1317(+)